MKKKLQPHCSNANQFKLLAIDLEGQNARLQCYQCNWYCCKFYSSNKLVSFHTIKAIKFMKCLQFENLHLFECIVFHIALIYIRLHSNGFDGKLSASNLQAC